MALASGKTLLHLSGRIRRVMDADDIYHLEAQGDETDVRQPPLSGGAPRGLRERPTQERIASRFVWAAEGLGVGASNSTRFNGEQALPRS